MPGVRSWFVAGLVAICALPATASAQAPPAALRSMAAIGDSLTAATRSCSPSGTINCKRNSWSTGDNPDVPSHYQRLRALSPAMTANNFAISGRKVAELFRQARLAVNAGAEYVTVLAGTPDICRETLDAMTPLAEFRAYFERAMTTFATRSPNAHIFVASIPDWSHLRAILKDNPTARQVWNTTLNCAVLLQNAEIETPAAQQRRAAAFQRLVDYNRTMGEICAQNPRCTFDNYAVFQWRFTPADITTTDYLHFTPLGQANLAGLTYPLAFLPPSPLPGATPGTPGSAPSAPGARRSPAKLKVKRASIGGGRLDALLSVTGRATGTLRVRLEAGGKTTFNVDLGAASAKEKTVRIRRPLTAALRGRNTGILSVSYAGNSRVQPDSLRARAANGRSNLRVEDLTFASGRLKISGTINPRVDGNVRLRVTYTRSNGSFASFKHSARIRNGRWSADKQLPLEAVADPEAYLTTQYTGDRNAAGGPYRGEQQGKVVGQL